MDMGMEGRWGEIRGELPHGIVPLGRDDRSDEGVVRDVLEPVMPAIARVALRRLERQSAMRHHPIPE